MAEEVDVITHLLEIEHEASQMMADAQKEADKKVADARAEAECIFKEKYGKISAEIDAEENSRKEQILKEHEESLSSYRKGLESMEKDCKSFDALLDKVLYN